MPEEARSSEPELARLAGVTFYQLPDELECDQVDPLIWPIVRRINESGWVWTGESCQGHPDADYAYPWAGNVRPYLRLVCRARRCGDLLDALTRAQVSMYDPTEVGRYLPGLQLWRYQTPEEWAQVGVYVEARTVYERNHGLELFRQFAELVCR